jgi:hypothetical protein
MTTHSLKVTVLHGPAFYWKKACDFGSKGFTVSDLAGCTSGIANSTVRKWVRDMAKDGELKVIGARPGIANSEKRLYAVTRPRLTPPTVRRPDFIGVAGQVQQQVWNTMRMLSLWTLEELALAASTKERPVSRNAANKYVAALVRAGIVSIVKGPAYGEIGHMGARSGFYKLNPAANSGPAAPQILRAKFVFDINKQKIIGESEVTHDRD